MATRNTFICNKGWATALNKLPDDSRIKVYDAIFEYAQTGNVPEMDFVCDLAFTPIKQEMDDLQKKEETKKHLRSQAGKIGMENRWHNKNNNVISVITKDGEKENQETERETPSKEKEKEIKEKEGDFSAFLSEIPVVPKTKPTFVPPTYEQVKAYFIEKGRPDADPQGFIDYYESVGWKVGKKKMVSWRGAVGNWFRHDINQYNARKHTLLQDDSKIGKFNTLLIKNFPFIVGHMKQLVTEAQLNGLLKYCTYDQIVDALCALEDRQDYTKKHTNLYLTLYEWLKDDIHKAAANQ